jgi:hypothetical protein
LPAHPHQFLDSLQELYVLTSFSHNFLDNNALRLYFGYPETFLHILTVLVPTIYNFQSSFGGESFDAKTSAAEEVFSGIMMMMIIIT